MASIPSKKSSLLPSSRQTLVLVLLAVLMGLGSAAAEAKKKKKNQESLLEGHVINEAGEVLAGVEALLFDPAKPDFRVEATSNDKGQFRMTVAKPVGSYELRLSKDGYTPYTIPVALGPGERQGFEFRLIGEGAGRKRDAIIAYNEGVKAMGEGDREAAKGRFLAATELSPALAEVHLGLTDIYYAVGDYAASAASVEKYRALKPEDPEGLRLAFRAYDKLGDADKAASVIAEAKGTAIASPLATRIYNQGAAATQSGNLEEAAKRFETALELDPSLVPAWEALSTIQYNGEQYAEALASVAALLELEPENVQARRVRYLVYDALNQPAEATEALIAYRAVDPSAADQVLYQRADLDFRAGDIESAKKALISILETSPDMPRAHYTLGLCYLSSSDKGLARKHLERFLALAPDDPEAGDARDMLSYL